MSKSLISTGINPNDGNGDTLLAGATKVNSNFNEIYSALGNGTDINIGVGKTVISTNSLGNVGVGTTNPTSKLQVQGDVLVSGIATISVNSSTDALRITQTGTGNALVVEDGTNPDSSPFVIKGGGYGWVGIGTTNPTSKLEVIGNMLVTGITTVGLGSTSTPPSNSQLSFELTSDTNLRIKVRGTDGVLRSANITLA